MNVGTTSSQLARFRAAVERCLGLRFDDARLGVLEEALARRAGASGGTEPYLSRLDRSNPSKEEIRALALDLTVGETYFFRNAAQFQAFSEVAVPGQVAARASSRKLRILSAGCSSGEEAYSLAIGVRELALDPAWEVSITAIDVNPASLEKASRGRYSTWSLRETPARLQQRWFQTNGVHHALDPSILSAVRFLERNLADEEPSFWFPEAFDVVFCRNVLMYFAPEQARSIVARIERSLTPGGHLFLGHAETLRGLSDDFLLCHTHGTFYYQRPSRSGADVPGGSSRELGGAGASLWSADTNPPVANVLWASTWVETVQQASERIRVLSERPGAVLDGDANARRPRPDVSRALELLAHERFADALESLDGLSDDATHDPDVLLLRAVLLTHGGRLEEAEKVCSQLLEMNEKSAGAHYLLALCREGSGDRKSANAHDQAAAYFDPAFAMPRLHLGLLARRAGDAASARQELKKALLLLSGEDASRILLFGGGFTRETLIQLCRAEIAAAGGQP